MPAMDRIVHRMLRRAPVRRFPFAIYYTLSVDLIEIRRSEEHTSELQSQSNLVCRLLLEKKKKTILSTFSDKHEQIVMHVLRAFLRQNSVSDYKRKSCSTLPRCPSIVASLASHMVLRKTY